jgi:hypothetical protein
MVLAPTLLLNAGSGAIVRPTFSRDFAGEKTLNNGTGPSITFTRASDATYFDADGVLQTASSDTPRFDHSGGSSLGLLIEEARTNSIRNSQAGGATSSTLPTNWMSYTDAGTIAVVGTGTEGGMTYVDVKFSGTNGSGSPQGGFVSGDSTTQVVASSGQTWTCSWYVKLVSGTTSGVQAIAVRVQERKSDTSLNGHTQTTLTPTSSYQRISATRTLDGATTARVTNELLVGWNGSATIDITLRIAAPQLEQGAFPTSYIPTTSAAVTRALDSAIVTPISSFYNQAEGTLFAEATPKTESLHNGFQRVLLTANDNTDLNQITIGQGGSGNLDKLVFVSFINAGGGTAEMFGGSGIAGSTQKAAGAYKASDFAFSVNGGAVDTEASGSPASGITHLFIGRRPADGVVSGHIRKIAYFPKRLSNALLQSLTT